MSATMTAAHKAPSSERKLARRTLILMVVLSLCSTFLLTWLAVKRFEQILLPQVLEKSRVIGASVQGTVNDATALGIPFDALVGVEDFLSDTLAENPEIAYLTVTGPGRSYSRKRAGVGATNGSDIITQQVAGSDTAPSVTIGVRASYVDEKMYIMFGDATAVLLVALVAGLEVGLFFVIRWLLRPLDTWRAMIAGVASGDIQRELRSPGDGPFAELLRLSNQKIAALRGTAVAGATLQPWYRPAARDVRIALFLFVLSEELLRSFFPLYVKELVDTGSRLSTELAISAPMMAYMFFAGAGTLFGGGLVDRMGIARAFGISVLMSVAGLCGLAVASTLAEVLLWRSITAVGYAIATIAAQVFISRTVQTGVNTKSLATYVAAVTAACICGAPIGAVLADLYGKQITLLCAACLALLSWLVFRGVELPPKPERATAAEGAAGHGFLALLKNGKILLLMICAVIPGKMLLGGLLFYITPLMLQQAGWSQTSIGQFFMLFYVLLLGGNAMSSRLADGASSQARLVVAGALLSGVGALSLLWFNSSLALAATIVCFGFGQSLMVTPVSAILLKLVQRDLPHVASPTAISLARMMERVGSIAGTALAAVLAASMGYRGAAAMLGIIVIVLGAGTLPFMRFFPARDKTKGETA